MPPEPLQQLYPNYMLDLYPADRKAWKNRVGFSFQTYGVKPMTQYEPVDILVVEDNDSQRASIVLALQNSIPDVLVIAVGDGIEALDFLFCRGVWTDRVGEDPPKLILLDLSLPGADGFSVLAQIRSFDPEDAVTLAPIVIFSDSEAPGDISKCYRCGANSYIIKPLSFPDFQTIVEKVGHYWMTHNETSV